MTPEAIEIMRLYNECSDEGKHIIARIVCAVMIGGEAASADLMETIRQHPYAPKNVVQWELSQVCEKYGA